MRSGSYPGVFPQRARGCTRCPGPLLSFRRAAAKLGSPGKPDPTLKASQVVGFFLCLGSSGDQRTRALPRLCARVLGEDATRGNMFTRTPRAAAATLHLLAAGRRSASAPSWLSCCPINPLPHSSQSTLHPWWAPCWLPAAGRGLWGLLGAAGSALKRQPAPGLSNSGD